MEDDYTVKFDGLEGYYMGMIKIKASNGEYCDTMVSDPGFYDVKYATNVTDTKEEQTCEATLYFSSRFRVDFYLLPVYLTDDGTYYTIPGSAQGASYEGLTSGGSCSQSIDSAITTSSDGNSKTKKNTFIVHEAIVDEAKKTVIKEMNQEDELIKTTEYLQSSPDEFVVDSETAYIIVEEVLNNASKGDYTKRSIYTLQPMDSKESPISHRSNFPGENGVIGQKTIQFIYE